MTKKYQHIAFGDQVRATQKQNGSAMAYSKERVGNPDNDEFGEAEIAFMQNCNSFYMATIGETGWPYVQHRGGPMGFIKLLSATRFVIPDFRGNRQYISLGNFKTNNRVSLFFMDYPRQARLKVFAKVSVVDIENNLEIKQLFETMATKFKIERALEFRLEAFDWNCPKYITPRYTENDVKLFTGKLLNRISELEAELAASK